MTIPGAAGSCTSRQRPAIERGATTGTRSSSTPNPSHRRAARDCGRHKHAARSSSPVTIPSSLMTHGFAPPPSPTRRCGRAATSDLALARHRSGDQNFTKPEHPRHAAPGSRGSSRPAPQRTAITPAHLRAEQHHRVQRFRPPPPPRSRHNRSSTARASKPPGVRVCVRSSGSTSSFFFSHG